MFIPFLWVGGCPSWFDLQQIGSLRKRYLGGKHYVIKLYLFLVIKTRKMLIMAKSMASVFTTKTALTMSRASAQSKRFAL